MFNSALTPKKEIGHSKEQQNSEIIKEKETIKVLLFSKASDYFLYKGNPIGFQYDMFQELEVFLKQELDIVIESDANIAMNAFFTNEYDIVALDFKENSLLNYYQTFSLPHSSTYSVLVGKKRCLTDNLQEAEILTSSHLPVVIEKDSLPENISWNIVAKEIPMEDVFEEVQNSEGSFLICDYNEALTMLTFYTDLMIVKQVGKSYHRRWRFVGQNAELNQRINAWLEEFTQSKKYEKLCKKYFSPKSQIIAQSFAKNRYNKISPFDAVIKKASEKGNLDWRFLASVIYQESKFQTGLVGIGGSFGVMQLMPVTGAKYGVDENSPLEEQIYAGVKYINKLQKIYRDIPEEQERLKFVAGAYNSGPGHINDAQRLCVKYGKDPTKWEDVAHYLTLKNKKEYYKDSEVNHGYYPGSHTVKYVAEVMTRYTGYCAAIN